MDCGLQTRGKMQTEGKMQTAGAYLVNILCYFHHQVLTVNRVLQANHIESALHLAWISLRLDWLSLQLAWISHWLAWIMSQLACLQLALNDGNGNTIQLKSLQSAFYPWSAVCILSPVHSLQSPLRSMRSRKKERLHGEIGYPTEEGYLIFLGSPTSMWTGPKGVCSRSNCCYGNLLCHENNVFTRWLGSFLIPWF